MLIKPCWDRKCCQETRSLDEWKRQTSRIWLYRICIIISHLTNCIELVCVKLHVSHWWCKGNKWTKGAYGLAWKITVTSCQTAGPGGPRRHDHTLAGQVCVFLAYSALLHGKPQSSFTRYHEKGTDFKIIQIWGWPPALLHDPGRASEMPFHISRKGIIGSSYACFSA